MVLTNLLYKNEQLARAFTWRPPTSTQGISTDASNSDHRDTATIQPVLNTSGHFHLFPEKTRDLGGATLNVSTKELSMQTVVVRLWI